MDEITKRLRLSAERVEGASPFPILLFWFNDEINLCVVLATKTSTCFGII